MKTKLEFLEKAPFRITLKLELGIYFCIRLYLAVVIIIIAEVVSSCVMC